MSILIATNMDATTIVPTAEAVEVHVEHPDPASPAPPKPRRAKPKARPSTGDRNNTAAIVSVGRRLASLFYLPSTAEGVAEILPIVNKPMLYEAMAELFYADLPRASRPILQKDSATIEELILDMDDQLCRRFGTVYHRKMAGKRGLFSKHRRDLVSDSDGSDTDGSEYERNKKRSKRGARSDSR